MSSVLEAIKARRSQRSYQNRQLEQETLERILEAGRYAPTGGNLQSVHFLVIRNADILKNLRILVERGFRKIKWSDDLYISIKNGIKNSQKGMYPFYYEAPVLVVLANKKGNLNGLADSACAAENMMLEATELGIGSCWINQLHWLDDDADIRSYLEVFGLGKDETICASVALGYAADGEKRSVPERTGMKVTYID